ncbi:MAG: hypothetical protein WD024_06860 [Bacillota bacterium]
MSGRVLSFSPQSKTYVPRASNGKYSGPGPVKVGGEGVIRNVPVQPLGPTVLSQHPAAPIGVGPVVKR